MSGFDFTSALDQKVDDVEKPPVLPVGTYIWAVTKEPKISQTPSGEWDIVEFAVKSVAADDDVDEDELAEYGNPAGVLSRVSFLAPTDPDRETEQKQTLWKLKKFLMETLQVEAEPGASMSEVMAGAVNMQFYATVSHRILEDSGDVVIDLKNYAALD